MRAPPEAANMMKGVPFCDGGFQALDHRLARRHAERAAHEVEILHADHDTGRPSSLPKPSLIASFRPVLVRASLSRSV